MDPDAITLDQEMPTMTGLAALRARRRQAPDAVVVMYSSDPSIEGPALAAGARAYFTEAESPREVVKTVIALLEAVTRGSAV